MSGVRLSPPHPALPRSVRGISLGEQIALLRQFCAPPMHADLPLYLQVTAADRAVLAAAATTLETLAGDPGGQFSPQFLTRKTGVGNG